MKTIILGQLRLSVLDDGAFPFPLGEFFANVAEAEWRPLVSVDDQGKAMVGHNCGLVKSRGELILIDTGYGDNTHGGRTGHLVDELERAGYRRDDVSMVALTHGHGDHCGRTTIVEDTGRRPAFPQATYFLGREDWDWFSGSRGEVHHFAQNFRAVADAGLLQLIDGAVQLTPEVSLVPSPGHTPGHVSVLMRSGEKTAIYLGDLCHHPLHFAHPEWVSSFDTDPAITPETRRWMFEMAVETNALVICPHARYPGIGHVRRAGGAYAWAALRNAGIGG